MVVILILLGAALIICSVKLYAVKYELNHLSKQLEDVKLNISTNQLIRTSTHNRTSSRLTTRINEMLQYFREDRMKLANKELELKKEMMNISHDLRTPLTSIKGYADLLESTESKEQQQTYVDIINKKIEMLLYTVDGFYEIAAMETESRDGLIEKINVNQFIVEILLNHYEDFDKNKINVDIVETPISFINGDKRLIERIIINIIQNTLRYAKQEVTVNFQEEQRFVIVQFENDSVYELPVSKDISKVFERSVTLDNSRSNGQRGLGLYIVKQLMERIEGNVKAEVVDDKFRLSLFFKK